MFAHQCQNPVSATKKKSKRFFSTVEMQEMLMFINIQNINYFLILYDSYKKYKRNQSALLYTEIYSAMSINQLLFLLNCYQIRYRQECLSMHIHETWKTNHFSVKEIVSISFKSELHYSRMVVRLVTLWTLSWHLIKSSLMGKQGIFIKMRLFNLC